MPVIHAGMTKSVFSSSVGERKIMNHSFEIKTKAIRERELCSNQPRVKRPGLIDVRS
jgi:hypothetical protein